jgi:hypothetical protein
MYDRYGKTPEREALDDIRTRLSGRSGYKSNFSVTHPKVTFHLSPEFREFPESTYDHAENDNELLVLDTLARSSRGLRGWRLQREMKDFGMSYNEIRITLENLESKGLIGHYRARSS